MDSCDKLPNDDGFEAAVLIWDEAAELIGDVWLNPHDGWPRKSMDLATPSEGDGFGA